MNNKITTKDFYLKVSISSEMLPAMQDEALRNISNGIFRGFDGWKNTAITVEDIKPEMIKQTK